MSGDSQFVPFTDESGRQAGSVTLPASSVEAGETLLVGPASPDATAAAADLDVASDIVNVEIENLLGVSVQPNGDIEVCLTVSDVDEAKESGCLSFYDEDRDRWVCEDPCLEFDGDTACGTTDHLTKYVNYSRLVSSLSLLTLTALLCSSLVETATVETTTTPTSSTKDGKTVCW